MGGLIFQQSQDYLDTSYSAVDPPLLLRTSLESLRMRQPLSFRNFQLSIKCNEPAQYSFNMPFGRRI